MLETDPQRRMLRPSAVRAAGLIVRDRTLAEDIVAETFLRVFQRIEQFDAGRPFDPWFLRCVVNAPRRPRADESAMCA